MEEAINKIKEKYPNSLQNVQCLINSENTNNEPGHLGEGCAITFKSEDSIIPPTLMSHRMFGHIVGLRLKFDTDKNDIASQYKSTLEGSLEYETFKSKQNTLSTKHRLEPVKGAKFDVPTLEIVTKNFKTQNKNEKHNWQTLLPYGGSVAIYCSSEDFNDNDTYWLLVQSHSGAVGRELYNKFFRSTTNNVTVKDFKNSDEFLACRQYSRQLSRALLNNTLMMMGLKERVDHDLYEQIEKDSTPQDAPSTIQMMRPHLDITYNDIVGDTFYNECYHSIKSVIGPELVFFNDTLHNGFMMERSKNIEEFILPIQGNFYADNTELVLHQKHLKKIQQKEWILRYDYPYLKPKLCEKQFMTTPAALKKLKKGMPEDTWDNKHQLLPLVSVLH